METILLYLDNMFLNFPQIPEVLRAKENLAEMMEDQYNELIINGKMENEAIGIVISEFGNIREVADALGIERYGQNNIQISENKPEKEKYASGKKTEIRETKISGTDNERSEDNLEKEIEKRKIQITGTETEKRGNNLEKKTGKREIQITGTETEKRGNNLEKETGKGEIQITGTETEKRGDDSEKETGKREIQITGTETGKRGDDSEKETEKREIKLTGTQAKEGNDTSENEKDGMYMTGIETGKKGNETSKVKNDDEENNISGIKLQKIENHMSKSDMDHKEKDDMHTSETKKNHLKSLSIEDTKAYLSDVRNSAKKIALGVFLCICSPAAIMLLSGINDSGLIRYMHGYEAFGISILLIMVACACALFISSGMQLDKYEYLKKECFFLEKDFRQSVFDIRDSKSSIFTMKIIMGVVMCIVAVIPVLFAGVFFEDNDLACIIAVVILLVIVGLGVSLFITAGMESESYKVILQEQEFSIGSKSRGKIDYAIAGLFWACITVVYLVWSFRSGDWWITWIIWPLSELFYNVVSVIVKNAVGDKE